jgi:AP-3 complex subunit beta
MDSTALSELIPLLRTLLASRSPLTLGPTLTAFSEMCPDRLDLLHPFYRHICRQLGDADEWGQLVALDVLTRYARTMLDRPETAGATASTTAGNGGKDGEKKDNNEEDEFEGIDVDLAMLLDHAKPLLQSRNPAVILAAAKMYFSLAPAGHSSIGQELLAAPLLRLAGSVSSDASTSSEIAALTWQVIAPMAEERPVSCFGHTVN